MNNEKVLLGITGGIAAYKSAELLRLLMKQGYDVQVIMTPAATEFIKPLTFQALSGSPVFVEQFDGYNDRIKHIEMATVPSFIIIAPATANTISKIACGIADNLLTSVVLASTVPIFIFPSMNEQMFLNDATQKNIATIKKRGLIIMEPESGELACGISGKGRLHSPEKILQFILTKLKVRKDFSGKRVLVTAGPTREPLDPVRYFGNYSSGKMGFAIAKAFKDRGASVLLITGPTDLPVPEAMDVIKINTAEDMLTAVRNNFRESDIVVKAAAVADYRPSKCADIKIKKNKKLTVELENNPDILETIGREKKHQILVGFAAETDDIINNASKKLKKKNLDFIVVNDVMKEGCGFGTETNEVSVIAAEGKIYKIPLMDKSEVADKLIDIIYETKFR